MGMVPMAMTNTADSDIKTYGYAVFGQATYTLFDKLDLTAGLRYEYEKNKLDYTSDYLAGGMVVPGMSSDIRGRKHDDVFLPKAQIAYRWTPDFMTYAGVSRGYRSGGFNTSFLDVSDLAFDPEYSWNYEVGFKSSWFNNRVNFNTSLFYIDLSDQQVTQVLPTANTVIRNAGKSRSMGFEVEASALITEGLLFEGSFGYTDAKYRRYSDKVSPNTPTTSRCSTVCRCWSPSTSSTRRTRSRGSPAPNYRASASSTGTTPTPSSRIRMSW